MTPAGDEPERDDDGDAVAALEDLPAPLCEPLLRAVRRAADALPRSSLPGPLRPLAGWHPQRLTDPRARRAVGMALQDPRLRAQVGLELGLEAPADEDVGRLTRRLSEPDAVAALAAAGRWNDVAVLAADAAQSRRESSGAAAEPPPGHGDDSRDSEAGHDVGRLRADLDAARDRALEEERRAAGQQARAERAEAAVEQLTHALTAARGERDGLADELADLRRRYRSRVARLRQQVAEANARAGPAEQQKLEVAARLAELAEQLRIPPETAGGDEPAVEDESATAAGDLAEPGGEGSGVGAGLPRGAPAAQPGRPAVLPAGLSAAHPAGARSLLRTAGLTVVLDGYNVTKDPAGRPTASLDEQRRWLVTAVAAASARFGCRPIVIFDGTEPRPGAAPAARGVGVSFSSPPETADDHVVALVAEIDPVDPVAVVTSDRALQARVEPYAVDVISAGTFLQALQG